MLLLYHVNAIKELNRLSKARLRQWLIYNSVNVLACHFFSYVWNVIFRRMCNIVKIFRLLIKVFTSVGRVI